MKNDKKAKHASTEVSEFNIRCELQAGKTAEFIYSDFSLAEAHYLQLQSTGCVGDVAIKFITRSWKK